ncbi:uncharacterized protein LOC111628324 [Centruroides sculpturatus]|uniref:uncharacterized protein LOC111628324 n=1 Tax=Centruroides sculpturatus TaxID=218467 RepID=UPI000C6E5D5F|nr:uncharacterized protein LOC111628324 [Centruroides sculpturatus]
MNTTSLQVIESTKSEKFQRVYDDKQKQKQEFQYLTECEDRKTEDDRSLSEDESIEEYKKETTSRMDIFWHFLRKFPSVVSVFETKKVKWSKFNKEKLRRGPIIFFFFASYSLNIMKISPY